MFSTRAILLLSLFASSALASPILASPIDHLSHLRVARDEAILYPRQEQSTLTQPVTFQTVTTSQTDAGTITTTCTVTLSPVTAADGSSQVLEEKQCKITLGASGESSSSSSSNGGGNNTAQTSTTSSSTETATQSQETQTLTPLSSASSSAFTSATAVPAISEIGVTSIPVSATGTVSQPSSSVSGSASATASGSAPPAVSVIGPGQIPASATGTVQPAPASSTDTASETTPVTSVTTLSNGQISTSVITPSAAAAQEAAATTPGQKLEVLPIGLGVFAGVSVIALIVVGLVTYERTKYRKAFRQRKLAEAGANMGYGGMAERT